MGENQGNHKYRNFIYVIEKKVDGRWQPTWDFEAHLTYNITDQIMKDYDKYNKHPESFRIVMYLSEKPCDE